LSLDVVRRFSNLGFGQLAASLHGYGYRGDAFDKSFLMGICRDMHDNFPAIINKADFDLEVATDTKGFKLGFKDAQLSVHQG
jgi:hypothetical protein